MLCYCYSNFKNIYIAVYQAFINKALKRKPQVAVYSYEDYNADTQW